MSKDNQRTCPLPIFSCSSSQVQIQTEASHPKATYEQVVADERAFMETLEDLHKCLGTKFMVPTVGGKPLDLHHLFVEVTRRGGLQKVIRDRKWKDVTSAFTFPSTITSASFALRKYYISLLQTYEQVYFFLKRDLKIPSNGVDYCVAPQDAKVSSASEACGGTVSTMLRSTAEHQIPEHPPLRVGSLVKGKINAKFENGYIVMANFGSEILNGILYHVPLQPLEKHNLPLPSHRRGRKRSRRETDLSNLKSDLGGFNIFFAEHYSQLRPLYSGKEKVIVKHINSLWNNLTESEKEAYQERDKERYKTGTSKDPNMP